MTGATATVRAPTLLQAHTANRGSSLVRPSDEQACQFLQNYLACNLLTNKGLEQILNGLVGRPDLLKDFGFTAKEIASSGDNHLYELNYGNRRVYLLMDIRLRRLRSMHCHMKDAMIGL